ncbi:MAG: 30S ribosomal protein S27ae [Nitrososphaerales archaeon]
MTKKGFSPKVWSFYKLEGSIIKLVKKECPRCGKGVFMAEHNDRFSCGKCGLTKWKKSGV